MGDLFFKLRVLRWMVGNAYEEWRDSVWRRDLDSSYCCDGRECGCAATTVRELWGYYVSPTPSTETMTQEVEG